MSREQSDGGHGVLETEVDPVDDATAEAEVDFRRLVGLTRDRTRCRRICSSSSGGGRQVWSGTDTPTWVTELVQTETAQVWVADSANSGTTQGPDRKLPGAGTQPVKQVTERYAFKMPTPTYPGPARPLQGTGTQLVTDRFTYELSPRTRTQPGLDRLRDALPDMPNSVPGYAINCRQGQKCMT